MNTWAVPVIRYLEPFWTREKLKQMDQETKKQMTMHKALHPRNDYTYQESKAEEDNIGERIDASIQQLEDYIEKYKKELITASRKDTINRKTKE